jgi:hypothetical protein
MTKFQNKSVWIGALESFEIGIWVLFGIWCLGIGASSCVNERGLLTQTQAPMINPSLGSSR